MTRPYRTKTFGPETGSVSWEISGKDEFILHRVLITWDSAPVTSDVMVVSLDSVNGSNYDAVLENLSPVGATVALIEDIGIFQDGDVIKIEYDNTDGNTLYATATYEI